MNSTDIRNKTFSNSMRGYKPTEVRAFMNELSDAFEKLERELEAAKQELGSIRSGGMQTPSMESAVVKLIEQVEKRTDAMLNLSKGNAEQTRGQIDGEKNKILALAREEAALIIREAEQKSAIYLTNANAQLKQLQEHIDKLHAQRVAIITRMKSLLVTQVEFLESLQQNLKPMQTGEIGFSSYDAAKGLIDADELAGIIKRLEEIEGSTP